MTRAKPDARNALLLAAAQRRFEPRSAEDPWVYGWCLKEHRRSEQAVVPHDDARVVRFSPQGVEAIEVGVEALLSMASVRATWKGEEIWGVVARMVAALPIGDGDATWNALDRGLQILKEPGPTLVIVRLAHVQWNVAPLRLKSDCVIGRGGKRLHEEAELLLGRPLSSEPTWLAEGDGGRGPSVVFAALVQSAGSRATDQAEQQLERLVELSLLFEPDKERRRLYSLRGDTFRPGVRGLTLDRHVLQAVAREEAPQLLEELGADVYHASSHGSRVAHMWRAADPWPLDEFLADPSRLSIVEELVTQDCALARRFQTSARWYARAHWAADKADALLALGIAVEALLGESGGSPGRVLAERYALLHSDIGERGEAQRFFSKRIYEPRCAVAHGALSSVDDVPVREIERKVSWIACTLWGLVRRDRVRSEDDHRALFDALKWGTRKPV